MRTLISAFKEFAFNLISASYIKICNQSDPRLGACIRNSIISLKPYLIKGIPEIDVPSLDPLYVPEIKILQSGGIQISANFKNITVSGPSKFRLRSNFHN